MRSRHKALSPPLIIPRNLRCSSALCSTYVPQTTSIKGAQTDLRLANAKTTQEHYIKLFPESVRVAVESLVDLLE